ncbi:MAG: histidine kinase [Acidobacteria bacterium]|nr:histidine kinase [Acidobacteriota bacterium]
MKAIRGRRPVGASRAGFHDLMQRKVGKVLLVSSLYDSFMISEDSLAEELVRGEFLGVELSTIPALHRVSTGAEALAALDSGLKYDLVITSPLVGDMDAAELSHTIRQAGYEMPLILLAYHENELQDYVRQHGLGAVDRAFLFQGDNQLLLAIVKYVEDLINARHDVDAMGVQMILVIEDNIRYYSYFLPVVYTAVLRNTASLLPDGLNLAHKLLRVRARPKILLASTYEEAAAYFEEYGDNILGVISDVEFPKNGELCHDAGVQFARAVLEKQYDVPVLLNSGKLENGALARGNATSFVHKYSPTLLSELDEFMAENFGFGDFIFRTEGGREVGRAHDMKSLETAIRQVPGESITFHAERNHFSTWLKAHTEFAIAHRLRPRRLSDFKGAEDIREFLIRSIRQHRDDRRGQLVADFDPRRFSPEIGFARIGSGSLGGKARGLAFARKLLREARLDHEFEDVRIRVPASVVVAADIFDAFLDDNGVRDLVLRAETDEAVADAFAAASFPDDVRESLRAYLALATYPLAVRSSSLLEDAKYQPFSGVYETVMISNDHDELDVRLERLEHAIKRVYASTFSQKAKRYVGATSYRLEGEKMAVILQRVVGATREDRFYPDFAGVALSQNFYPVGPVRPDDGLAAVALGLGAEVVEGEQCLRFSPRHPDRLLQMSSVKDALRNSQREFYSVRLGGNDDVLEAELVKSDLATAERDGTLAWLGSTFSPENDMIYEGVGRPGVRLVTFAPMLKHGLFPLAEVLAELLDLGTYAAGGAVEIEFAVSLDVPAGTPKDFGFLQLRPVVHTTDPSEVDLRSVAPETAICESTSVLGSGRVSDLRDIVFVDQESFERGQSQKVAGEVARLNDRLCGEDRPYLLVGVGRWGSADHFLGIPVAWHEISGARVIVEAGFKDFKVTPSQGTHFFQNLVANNVGYFTVNPEAGEGTVDWEWLRSVEPCDATDFVRHLRFETPLTVLMDGRSNSGAILRPAEPPQA